MTHITINPSIVDKFPLVSYHHQRQSVTDGVLLTFFSDQPS
jgi:hypothetical protein